MRIALCCSGHLRTIKECFPTLEKNGGGNLFDGNIVDLFLCTSDSNEYQNEKYVDLHENQIKKLLPFNHVEYYKVPNRIENLIMENYDLDVVVPETISWGKSFGYPASMFHKIFISQSMREDYESKNNFKYDLVFRIRPDLFYKWFPFNCHLEGFLKNKDILYIPMIQNYDYVNDQFAIGSSKTMSIYKNLYKHFREWVFNHMVPTHLIIEQFPYWYFHKKQKTEIMKIWVDYYIKRF